MIGLDGARPAALRKANTPAIDSLIGRGMWSWQAETQNGNTRSSPGWMSMMTGVNPSKHGVPIHEDYST